MKTHGKLRHICMALLAAVLIAGLLPAAAGTGKAYAAGKVRLNQTRVQSFAGETVKLKVKGTKSKVRWSSSNKKVATVTKKGKVKLKKPGRCTIRAKVGKRKLKCRIIVEERQNEILYDSDVKQDAVQGPDYLCDTAAEGDTFTIIIKDDPAYDDIQVGDILLLPANDTCDGLLFRVDRFADEHILHGYRVLEGSVPGAEEVFQSIDLEEAAKADVSTFQANPDIVTSVHASSLENEEEQGEESKEQTTVEGALTINDKITLDLAVKVKDKETNTTESAQGTVVITPPTITPDIEIVRENGKMVVKSYDFRVAYRQDTSFSMSLHKDLKPIYLGVIPGIPLGDGFVADLLFYLSISAEGTASIETVLNVNAGVKYDGSGDPKPYSDCSFDATGSLDMDARALMEAKAMISLGGFWNYAKKERKLGIPIVGATLSGGPIFHYRETLHYTKPKLCQDFSAYAYLGLELLEDTIIGDVMEFFELKRTWEILGDNEENPLRWNSHFEDAKKVRFCTYRNPVRFFKSINEIGHTFKKVSGRYTLHSIDGADGYAVYACDANSFEFDFTGSKVVQGEYGSYRTIVASDPCHGMHGTAEDLLGISSPMKVSTFTKRTGLKLSKKEPRLMENGHIVYWMPCLHFTQHNNSLFATFRLKGISHKCMLILCGVPKNGTIKPDTKVFVEGGKF